MRLRALSRPRMWRRVFRSPRTHGEVLALLLLARGILDPRFRGYGCRPGRLQQAGLPADKGLVEVLMRVCVPYRMQNPRTATVESVAGLNGSIHLQPRCTMPPCMYYYYIVCSN